MRDATLSRIALAAVLLLLAVFGLLARRANLAYAPASRPVQIKLALFSRVPLAAPATVTAGRNIAFETGNALANAPASYLTQLDCCESDEAIAERIALGSLRATVRHKGDRRTP